MPLEQERNSDEHLTCALMCVTWSTANRGQRELEFSRSREGVAVASSDKTRILVYCVFFLAVVLLAALYRPADAFTRPAGGPNVVLHQ